MILRDWDIWHVYASFLTTESVDLRSAGQAFIDSGLAVCALHRDGYTWWKSEDGTRRGMTRVELASDRRGALVQLEPEGGSEPDLAGYTAEAWYQAAHFRFNELRVFGEDAAVPPPYVRAVLGEFHLTSRSSGFAAIVYPVVKLFATGVILVQFRTMAPSRDVDLGQFIDRFVNLFSVRFEEVEVPPGVTELAAVSSLHTVRSWPLHRRVALDLAAQKVKRGIAQTTREVESGDFTAALVPLLSSEERGETLASLANMLVLATGFALSEPRRGIGFVLRGQRSIATPGDYWSGRPHVYLLDFAEQRKTATENVRDHRASFGWILGRHAGESEAQALRYLPEDQRHFEDYSAFVTQAATLWVWSRDGVERQEEWADANRGHLIYEHQATVEMLEYGYLLHRALLATTGEARSQEEVLRMRRALQGLRYDMSQASVYGEVRDLLNTGWTAMGVDELQVQLNTALETQSSEVALRDAQATEQLGRSLTILFGLLAVPPLASEVVAPLWELLDLWSPAGDAAERVFFVVVAVTFVIALIALVRLVSKKAES